MSNFVTPRRAIAKVGLALNRNWTTESGEKKEEVTFVDVDSFGKQAEVIAQYLRKGDPILIEGRLKMDSWDDKQTGQKKSKLGVVLEQFSFIGGGEKKSDAPAQRPQASIPTARTSLPRPPGTVPNPTDDSDDIPF